MNKENSYPLISVVMRAYKVERFIKKAVEGVLMQDYGGEIELIISNDNSPDRTHEIVKGIKETHPRGSWIRYVRHRKNKGMIDNFIWTLRQAKGEFIAPCDGDDYWTDPFKIRRQVEFMKAHPDCTICGHAFKVQYGDLRGDRIKRRVETASLCTLGDFLEGKGFRVWTSTMLFKTALVPEFEEWFGRSSNIDDFAIFMIAGHHGRIGYLPEVMSVYNRESTPDAWSSNNKDIDEILKYIEDKNEFFEFFNKKTGGQYKKSIKKNQQRSLKRYAHNIRQQGYSRREQLQLLTSHLSDYLRPEKENFMIWLNLFRG